MFPKNILSVHQGIIDIKNNKLDISKSSDVGLRFPEAITLEKLCIELRKYSCEPQIFSGYYIGYSIKQISKEFDILRFGSNAIINIELKAPLDEISKLQKIPKQMKQNYYYLNFLGKPIYIYTFVEDDGLYKYDISTDAYVAVSYEELISNLSNQGFDSEMNPDKLFVPSNYLISPFNNTEKFLAHEYFLTDNQQEIKKQIMQIIQDSKEFFFCISAKAGTGKTLLLYDIAEDVISEFEKASTLIIHCGKLNSGHNKLIHDYGWNIEPIATVHENSIDKKIDERLKVILVDESQRIREHQLEAIVKKAVACHIPIVFSYDKQQYLKKGETCDLYEYVSKNFSDISASKKELTSKIRTNKEMASFITNFMHIGKSNTYLNYNAVTIEYFNSLDDVKKYVAYLEQNEGWKAVKYTTSRYSPNSLDRFGTLCTSNAHDVIGQEFKKVVFVMDRNFHYNENGQLLAEGSYYSTEGMLYQIVTRVVNELKIIVLSNPQLYCKLLEIKSLGTQE